MSNDPNRTEYIVICRGDAGRRYACGRDMPVIGDYYELATRTVFPTRAAALKYASGINSAREALVVPGRWGGLRWDADERFPPMKPRSPGKMPG